MDKLTAEMAEQVLVGRLINKVINEESEYDA
jgi:hypothetical protein